MDEVEDVEAWKSKVRAVDASLRQALESAAAAKSTKTKPIKENGFLSAKASGRRPVLKGIGLPSRP